MQKDQSGEFFVCGYWGLKVMIIQTQFALEEYFLLTLAFWKERF